MSPYKITRGFLHTPIRRIHDHDGPATDYAGITADVLPAAGSRQSRVLHREQPGGGGRDTSFWVVAVSYTHLTLPTKRIV